MLQCIHLVNTVASYFLGASPDRHIHASLDIRNNVLLKSLLKIASRITPRCGKLVCETPSVTLLEEVYIYYLAEN
jgi:hypothetical protein